MGNSKDLSSIHIVIVHLLSRLYDALGGIFIQGAYLRHGDSPYPYSTSHMTKPDVSSVRKEHREIRSMRIGLQKRVANILNKWHHLLQGMLGSWERGGFTSVENFPYYRYAYSTHCVCTALESEWLDVTRIDTHATAFLSIMTFPSTETSIFWYQRHGWKYRVSEACLDTVYVI